MKTFKQFTEEKTTLNESLFSNELTNKATEEHEHSLEEITKKYSKLANDKYKGKTVTFNGGEYGGGYKEMTAKVVAASVGLYYGEDWVLSFEVPTASGKATKNFNVTGIKSVK